MGFGECINRLHVYANSYGWTCNINSWVRKTDHKQVWVIYLNKGPVAVHATGASLKDAAEQMLRLIAITEKIALSI